MWPIRRGDFISDAKRPLFAGFPSRASHLLVASYRCQVFPSARCICAWHGPNCSNPSRPSIIFVSPFRSARKEKRSPYAGCRRRRSLGAFNLRHLGWPTPWCGEPSLNLTREVWIPLVPPPPWGAGETSVATRCRTHAANPFSSIVRRVLISGCQAIVDRSSLNEKKRASMMMSFLVTSALRLERQEGAGIGPPTRAL